MLQKKCSTFKEIDRTREKKGIFINYLVKEKNDISLV